MLVNQVYEIVNQATSEILGEEAVAGADLTKVIDIGKSIISSGEQNDVERYVQKLVDKVGKVVFVNRPYAGMAPKILMEGWQYGSILQKIDAGISEAEANDHWQLVAGTSYDQDKYTPPSDVRQKFWNRRTTFQVPISISSDLLESAFTTAEQLNGFLSMIQTKIETTLTIKRDALIMFTIGNFISGTLYNEHEDGNYGDGSGIRAINLLYLYNQAKGTSLTQAKCLTDMEFLKFASYTIAMTSKHLIPANTQYNIGGRVRHTPKDRQKIILLDSFAEAANFYLQSDTFNNEFVKLPTAETVPYWQAPGTNGYAFKDVSSIHYNTYDPTADLSVSSPATVEVVADGILGVIFDEEALGVMCEKRKVTQHYNGKADFFNYWHKEFAGYFNDFDENGVVFYVADPSSEQTLVQTADPANVEAQVNVTRARNTLVKN